MVILGQDPYYRPGQAHGQQSLPHNETKTHGFMFTGLCFSVQQGIKCPRSLKNIYKELQNDIPGFVTPSHGNLVGWVNQGIILL